MTEEERSALTPIHRWPTLDAGNAILGRKLLDLIDWVWDSKHVLDGNTGPEAMPLIAMPPVQRSAVWRPKQVLDLWDSLMRWLPIGTFYIVAQPARPRTIVRLSTDETIVYSGEGFDLLDGQQRVRALLVGAYGFKEEKRCLWVDLGSEIAKRRPCLRLTSKAQPFGYDDETGEKRRLWERRKARAAIEPEGRPIQVIDVTGLRRAYDHELFDCQVTQHGRPITQPPVPYGATEQQTFPLHELLQAWRECAPGNTEEGIAALRNRTGDVPSLEALSVLHQAFCKVASAQVALLRVDPESFLDRDTDLLALFERIGAGGTALSREERLYSIYKYHAPYIRDAVAGIHKETGRVLPPVKIAATALRIANSWSED